MTEDNGKENTKWPNAPTAAKIDAEIAKWKHNRKLYPGWVVCPTENRRKLWNYTEHWIMPVLKSVADANPKRQLECLFELAWRYDTCLMPLFHEFAEQIAAVTTDVVPYPQLANFGTVALSPSKVEGTDFDWRSVSEQWLFLIEMLLRFYREALERVKFDELCARLSPLIKTDADLAAFVAYQRCLYSLERLDHESARQTLKSWGEIPSVDPLWRLRKAALEAELGNADDAERESALALKEIREGNLRSAAHADTDDIANLSKEGWALALIGSITAMRRLLANQERPDFRGRWEQLASLRCNPWPIIEDLRAAMTAEPPLSSSKRSRKDGAVRLSSQDGTYQRLQPAFQAARLVEEAAYPVSVPGVRIADSLLKRAGEWMSAEKPARALSLFIRLGDDDALQEFLILPRVASLSVAEVSQFMQLANTAITQATNQLALTTREVDRERYDTAYQQVRTALRILIALALRLDQKLLKSTIDLALGLSRSQTFHNDFDVHRKLGVLLRQAFSALQSGELSTLLLPVISQPLLDVDYHVHFASWRDDPCWNLFRQFVPPKRVEYESEWQDAISRLIRNLKADAPNTRLQALLRCCLLNRIGLLTPPEAQSVSDAVWQQGYNTPAWRDEFDPLPSWLMLFVPEPLPGFAREAFSRRVFGQPLATYRSPMDMPDGSKRSGWRMGSSGSGDALRSILLLSFKPLRPRNVDRFAPVIDLLPDEVQSLVECMALWWQNEGKELLSQLQRRPDALFGGNPMTTGHFKEIVEVAGYVLFPILSSQSPALQQLSSLMLEFEREGLAIELAKPVLLLAVSLSADEVASSIRLSIASGDEDRVVSALEGVRVWIDAARRGQLASPPNDLIREIGSIVGARRAPGLTEALRLATLILQSDSEIADMITESVRIGLQYLFKESQYGRVEDGEFILGDDEITRLRLLIARLVTALEKRVGPDDSVVVLWRGALAEDPINLIRAAAAAEDESYD